MTISGAVKRFESTIRMPSSTSSSTIRASFKMEWEVEMIELNHLRAYRWTSKTSETRRCHYVRGCSRKERRAFNNGRSDEARRTSQKSNA